MAWVVGYPNGKQCCFVAVVGSMFLLLFLRTK